MKRNIGEYIFLAICFFILVFFLIGSILRESPTYDEKEHIESGYQFLINKDFRYDPYNLPLTREIIALPTVFNKNLINDNVIFWPRFMVVIFTVFLGLLVYIFSKKLFGNLAGKLALILYIFEPNILAHGHYATTDLISTFFSFLTIYCFWLWRRRFNFQRLIIFSILLGLLLSTKITSIPFTVMPILILYIFGKRNIKDLISPKCFKKIVKPLFIVIFISLMTLWSTYFFKLEPPLGYRFEPNRPAIKLAKKNPLINLLLTVPVPLGTYMSAAKLSLIFNYTNIHSKSVYFMNSISQSGMPGYYFPVLFIIKTPILLSVMFISSLILFIRRFKDNQFILIPVFCVFLSALTLNITLANRYILPVYPFIIVYISQIVNIKIRNRNIFYALLAVVLIWYASGTIREYPHFISYMNEIIPKNDRYKVLSDSNYDWGQGLVDLEKYQDENNINNLKLAYFGRVDPGKYKIKHQIYEGGHDKKYTYAISATCLYFCGERNAKEFINKTPVDIIGGSILIYEN